MEFGAQMDYWGERLRAKREFENLGHPAGEVGQAVVAALHDALAAARVAVAHLAPVQHFVPVAATRK